MFLMLFSLLLLFITLLGFRRWVWWFTIFDFFRLQYFVLQIILCIFCLYNDFWILTALNLIGAIINFNRIKKFIPRFRKKSSVQKRDILCINVYKDNDDYDSLRCVLEAADPEILLLMEVTDALEENLESFISAYKYRLQTPVRDGFSICLLSKHKIYNPDITFHGANKTPLLHAQIELNENKYHVFSAHPKPALNSDWYHQRRVYFEEISDIIIYSKFPPIVLGDFNSVPWERHFVDFCHKTKLKSTAEGHGYPVTWPTYFRPLGIPMDHILLPQGLHYSNLKIGPHAGSDHYPIAIDL